MQSHRKHIVCMCDVSEGKMFKKRKKEDKRKKIKYFTNLL